MVDKLSDYKYSKQYILIEDSDNKFSKSAYAETGLENIDDYLYSVVTSVTQKEVNGVLMHLIQYEDKEIGWIELRDSIQVYRFKSSHFQVIEENFQSNELNQKMQIDKDFISHFKGKLLTVKSQVQYKGERYFSVFLKNKFHGFHHERHLDPLFKVNIPLKEEDLGADPELYMISNLTKPVKEIPNFSNVKLLSIFPNNKIGKIQLGKNAYWMDLLKLNDFEIPDLALEYKSEEQLILDDILYGVDLERNKSKEMVKSVLSAKDYLSDNKENKKLIKELKKGSNADTSEIKEELNTFKSENLDLKRQLRKEEKAHELAQKRLDHQLDYKSRVEEQRDKYKSRMTVVEEKLKNLDQKYKSLKEKYDAENSNS